MNIKSLFRKCDLFTFIFLVCISPIVAQPTISSFLPTTGPVGISVTIKGSNFSTTITDNIVLFGTIKATVTYATTNTLTVTVPNGAIDGYITVTNQNLVALSSIPFSVTFTSCPLINSGSFPKKSDFALGDVPEGLCAGDIDMDGRADLISANVNVNTISIFRNNSTGSLISFSPKIDLAATYYPQKVIMGDIDGDSKPEIIIPNSYSSSISVFKNLSTPGSILFAPKVDFITGNSPVEVAIGDLDGDGKIDLAVANGITFSLSILRNTTVNGVISFGPKADYAISLRPQSLSIGDLNRDGKPEVAVSSYNYSNENISIFKNTSQPGSVSFDPIFNVSNNGGGGSLLIKDMDGDSHADLCVANLTHNKISVFRNLGVQGLIGFESGADFSTGNTKTRVCIGDFDGDGKPDFASISTNNNVITLLKNTSSPGTVNFAEKVDITTVNNTRGVTIADFDLNGTPDIAIAGYDKIMSVIRRPPSQNIFLVDSSKTTNYPTGGCGVTKADWTTACRSLQVVLDAAQEGDEIWVAKGSYFPSRDTAGNESPANLHNMTFVIKSGVKIYGGFSGVETEAAQRNSSVNKTFLSGQLNNTGSTKVNNVIWFNHAENTTVLNGFIVKNGNSTNTLSGGGIYLNESAPVISNCIITNNSSASKGGGIFINNSTPTLINCSLYDNFSPYGGGIATNNSSPAIINCTIAKNAAASMGGGIYAQGSSPIVYNSIIWGNKGLNDTLDNIYSSGGGTAIVNYSIVGQQQDVFPGTGNRNANPLFVDAINNDFSLTYGSQAISTGNFDSYPNTAPVTDLAGNLRMSNGMINVGAYEGGKNSLVNSGVIFVNKSVKTIFGNGRSWGSAYASLSDALSVSNSNRSINELWVAKGNYTPTNDSNTISKTTNDGNSTFAIKRGIRILGGFSGTETNLSQRNISENLTILDGLNTNHIYPFNVASVVYVSNADSISLLDGFTIINGTGYYLAHGGGAISINNAKLAVNDCRILNNKGCGIYNMDGNLQISNSYFSGNSGQYGGAILNHNAAATIIDCNFFDNVPVRNDGFGGAIANWLSKVTIERSIFKNNKAVQSGGAIYNDNMSDMTVLNCKFIGNETDPGGRGGAVTNMFNSNAFFLNCVFVKNFAQAGGALSNYSGVMSVTNCSITDNVAYYGGGGIINYRSATTNISNTINWGNLSLYDRKVDNVYDYDSYSPFGSFNIDHSNIGLVSGIYPGTGNLNADPRFADTANSVVKLLYNSPAIDAGYNNSYAGNITSDVDVEGLPRLSGTNIDMGATESINSVCAGGNTSFAANLSGNTFQWQMNSGNGFISLNNNTDLEGADSPVLQLKNVPASWNGNQFRCLVDGSFSITQVLKLANQWQGKVSDRWEDPLNWHCNMVPDMNTDVIIDNGKVKISLNAICRSLTIKPGATVEVKSGVTLTITH